MLKTVKELEWIVLKETTSHLHVQLPICKIQLITIFFKNAIFLWIDLKHLYSNCVYLTLYLANLVISYHLLSSSIFSNFVPSQVFDFSDIILIYVCQFTCDPY